MSNPITVEMQKKKIMQEIDKALRGEEPEPDAYPNEVSICQTVEQFTLNIAAFIEREADQHLSAEKAYYEKMLAFAARVRASGIGGA